MSWWLVLALVGGGIVLGAGALCAWFMWTVWKAGTKL